MWSLFTTTSLKYLEKRWNIKNNGKPETVSELQQHLNVDRIIAALLSQRNISSFEEAKSFFRPDLNAMHDPFLMKDMDKAIERIDKAIKNNEKILVFGDYDVDGTTSVATVYSFFKKLYPNVGFYIPDRYKEGYGISFKGIDFAKENNFSLIIALDCGIKAIDKVEYANGKGIDFIICDHHLPGNELPKALAVLDPKRNDCPYPYKELSGCGIGFKLLQAYSIKNDIDPKLYFEYLDLVATSIAADIVPITGENRILAYFGIEKLNTNPRPGIKALIDSNQITKALTITSLVFIVGPRINAAGRLEHGSRSVELLVSEDETEAMEIAKGINTTNTQRKDLDMGTTSEAHLMLENDPMTPHKKSTVLFSENWHKGVIGIVASRLIEKYYKPTIILTESDGKATGSARSVKDFDVYAAIEQCSDLLEQFGGHKFAAGLTLKKENVEAFKNKFESIVCGSITAEQLIPRVDIDIEIELQEINDKTLRILKQFAPHGPENMTPLFCAKGVLDSGWGKVVGTNHLKLELFQSKNPNVRFPAIAYDKGDYLSFFQRKIPADIVFKIQENEFRGAITTQLVVEEIRVS
jgi:single-stranded-DNA-specific exonuclease